MQHESGSRQTRHGGPERRRIIAIKTDDADYRGDHCRGDRNVQQAASEGWLPVALGS